MAIKRLTKTGFPCSVCGREDWKRAVASQEPGRKAKATIVCSRCQRKEEGGNWTPPQ